MSRVSTRCRKWEDRTADLLAGEKVQVKVKGLEGKKNTSRWLNDWEQG